MGFAWVSNILINLIRFFLFKVSKGPMRRFFLALLRCHL